MKRTANDIVALDKNSSRAARKEFYSKIVSAEEFLLRDSLTIPVFVWLAWSIKESVCKLRQQKSSGFRFAAIKMKLHDLHCSTDASYICVVESDGFAFYTKSIIRQSYIHSIACEGLSFDNICHGVEHIKWCDYSSQSMAVRSFAAIHLRQFFPESDIRIEKNSMGIPVVLDGSRLLPVCLSLSHDGYYVAYAFTK